jgi:hypothetical protein
MAQPVSYLYWFLFLQPLVQHHCFCAALYAQQQRVERATAGENEDVFVRNAGMSIVPYIPEDETTFYHAFAKAFDDAHAQHVTDKPGQVPPPRTVNVVISLVQGSELPPWSGKLIAGDWGEHVSLSVYIKTEGLKLDEERELERRTRFEMIAIPNVGRNEHAYVWHLARRAPSFADVEILTKTNHVSEGMVRFMVDVARDGAPYESVSYPWVYDRRHFHVQCDKAWSDHPLYHEFCENGRDCMFGRGCQGMISSQRYKNGSTGLSMDKRKAVFPPFLSFAMDQLPQPLPLIHEFYGEGSLSVRRDVLGQFSASWYREWKNITFGQTETGTIIGRHDLAMAVLPLLFGRENQTAPFPAWLVSPSTVDLFDTEEGVKKSWPEGYPD